MTGPTDSALERAGQKVFQQMGFRCLGGLRHTPLTELDPSGPHSKSDHLEIDYLIPLGTACLIGEITGRTDRRSLERKYKVFAAHVNLIKTAHDRDVHKLWQTLGVPADQTRHFRRVNTLFGFVILSKLDRIDVQLSSRPGLCVFYKQDWKVLREYAEAIGTYAQQTFLEPFAMAPADAGRSWLRVGGDGPPALCKTNCFATTQYSSECDILVFKANAYELLKCARVYRRESISQDIWNDSRNYQRALDGRKLAQIRKALTKQGAEQFVFPGNILVVASRACRFNPQTEQLDIPMEYGALHVIDGQHRLFAYANDSVRSRVGEDATVIVTALHFPNAEDSKIKECSAQTFVEINTNQTAVKPLLLYDIAYDLLGWRDARSLSGKVLKEANRQGRLRRVLRTNDTPEGRIKMTELVSKFAQLLNNERLVKLSSASRGTSADARLGYENLFEVSVSVLADDSEQLKDRAIIVVTRYFNLIAKTFNADWNEIQKKKGKSAFALTKMFVGWLSLLKQFVSEGADWPAVREAVEKIEQRVGSLKGRTGTIVFDMDSPAIPNARHRPTDFFKFLDRNRTRRTRIETIAQLDS